MVSPRADPRGRMTLTCHFWNEKTEPGTGFHIRTITTDEAIPHQQGKPTKPFSEITDRICVRPCDSELVIGLRRNRPVPAPISVANSSLALGIGPEVLVIGIRRRPRVLPAFPHLLWG
jgi:hypothetical protein